MGITVNHTPPILQGVEDAGEGVSGYLREQRAQQEASDQHAIAQAALQKIQRQMAIEEQQRQGRMQLASQMGQTAQSSMQPAPEGDQGAGLGPGPWSQDALYTQDEKSQFQALGQQHAEEYTRTAGLAARAGLTPQEAALTLNWVEQQHAKQADKLRRTQNANKLAQQFQAGAYGDPSNPSVKAKGQELAQLAMDPNTPADDVWKAAAPTLNAVAEETRLKQIRAQHAEQMQKDAENIAAYTHQPLNPDQLDLLHQMAIAQGDTTEIRKRWDSYGKFGLVPMKDWKGQEIGVPYAQAQSFAQSQVEALQKSAEADLVLKEAEAAKAKSQAGLADVRGAAGGFRPPNISLPGGRGAGSTYNLSPSQARVRGIAEARSVYGPKWTDGSMSTADKEAAIKEHTANYTSAPEPNAVDQLMQSRALPFQGSADGTVLSKSLDTGGTSNRLSLDDFLKDWRSKNPNGSKAEAQAAWSKYKSQK